MFLGEGAVPAYAVIPNIQRISVELPLLGNYAWNGRINYNLLPRIPYNLQYKRDPKKIRFVHFSSKSNLIKIIEIIIKSQAIIIFSIV